MCRSILSLSIISLCFYFVQGQGPMPCDGRLWYFSEDPTGVNPQGFLSFITGYKEGEAVNIANACPLGGGVKNALGADPVTGFLYFTNQVSGNLIRLNPVTCNQTNICPGLVNGASQRGTFDNQGRYWVITESFFAPKVYRLRCYNINTCSPVPGKNFALPGFNSKRTNDLAFNFSDCTFYTGNDSSVMQIDTFGNVLNVYTPGFGGLSDNFNYGGIAVGEDGNLYGMQNDGDLIRFNMSTFSAQSVVKVTPATGSVAEKDMACFPCNSVSTTFQTVDSICPSYTIKFDDMSSGYIKEWIWDFGDGTKDTLNMPGAKHTYLEKGQYTVTLRVVPTDLACFYIPEDTFQLVVNVTGTFLEAIGDTTICINSSAPLEAFGGLNYIWSPGATLSKLDSSYTIAAPKQTTTYSVTSIDSSSNCIDNASVTVNVVPLPVVETSPDTTILLGTSADLYASGGVFYEWMPLNGLNDGDNYLDASPESSTYYTVKVTDSNGCSALDSILVEVIGLPNLFIPNAISLNGDNFNDVFNVIEQNILEAQVSIYNRSGKLVLQSTVGDLPKYKQNLNKGSYIYHFEGISAFSKQKIEKIGSILAIE